MFVLALALCALITVARHRSQSSGGNDALTNIARRILFSPVLRISNVFESWWDGDILSIFRGPELASENLRLRAKIASLMDENRTLADQADENVQLRALLNFKAHDPRYLLPAEVLALKPFSERDSAIFSRGSDDRVTIKQPALDENGNLIGQVTSVSSDTCDVMLLTDTLSSVGARVVPTAPIAEVTPAPVQANAALAKQPVLAAPAAQQHSSSADPAQAAVGICMGDHSGVLQLTDIDPSADVEIGDMVVTSGLGGVYPKDIPVGRVVAVDFDKTRYLKSAVVLPAADFNHLQEGFLVR